MLDPVILKFLSALEKHNDRSWFEANRDTYDRAKNDFLEFVSKLIPAIAAFDSPIGEQLAKNCVFRINRDVRFSKNKSPYKNNLGAYFNKDGKKGNGAGYYVQIQPGKSFIAAGIWQPEGPDLLKIRQEIDYNFDELKKIISLPKFKKNFPKGLSENDMLLRAPKGYEETNPAINFLKRKSFVVNREITDAELSSKQLVKNIAASFESVKPFIDFINRSLD